MTTIATKTQKGLLGTKLGMTQVWDETNRLVPVTVIQAGPYVVTQVRDADTDGYAAVQIGYGAIDPRKVTKPLTGHFEKAGVTPRRHVVELRTADAAEYTLGQELSVDTFEVGAGRRRHGHHQGQGLRRRHEASRLPWRLVLARFAPQPPQARLDRWLRHAGSRVQGHAHGRPHGWRASTTQNLTIHAVDAERGLLLVKGAVPGPRGTSSSSARPRRGRDPDGHHDCRS